MTLCKLVLNPFTDILLIRNKLAFYLFSLQYFDAVRWTPVPVLPEVTPDNR